MTWHTLKPANKGGGRKWETPAAKLYDTGQLTLNTAACTQLGWPPRVRLEVEPDARLMRLKPTTPDDQGGFSLSGGGNTPHRLMCRELVQRWPHLVGDYQVVRTAGGIELRIKAKHNDEGEDGELEL